MSGADVAKRDPLKYAATLIQRATEEEHPDGNPLAASRFYTTALEYIVNWAVKRATDLDNETQRRYFLSQLRPRLEIYHERATMLLQLASEIGMLDKPDQTALPPDDYDLVYPPMQTNQTMPTFVNDLLGPAVPMTAPDDVTKKQQQPVHGGDEMSKEDSQEIPGQPGWPTPLPPTMRHDTGKTAGDRAEPRAMSPPSPPEKINMDDLMRQLGKSP